MNPKLSHFQLKPIALLGGLLASGVALDSFGHGYVSEPPGRSFLCKLGDNTGCGAVQWEPQSVEGPTAHRASPLAAPLTAPLRRRSPSWRNQRPDSRDGTP